jgi:hypothetical protein
MFKCEYCNKEFKKENTLAVHMCERKRRYMQREEKHVQLAFRAYQLFYKIGTNSKKEKSYDDFAASTYYTGFVKFGIYCKDLRIDDVPAYTKWLLQNQIKLEKWTSDRNFNAWIKTRLKTESVDRAVERTVMFMQEWSKDSGSAWNQYFDVINPNVAVFHICSGKISPWVIYSSDKAQSMLDRFSGEQLKMILEYIEPVYWKRTTLKHPDDVAWVNNILKEADLA